MRLMLSRSKQSRPPLPPPHVLSTLVPDSPAFTELMKVEQRLDWTLIRKKAEINDALGRPIKVGANEVALIAGQKDTTSVHLKRGSRSNVAERARRKNRDA